MKKKVCVLLACIAALSVFGVAFAQNTGDDVLPATDTAVSTTVTTMPAVPAPEPTEPTASSNTINLNNLAFFDTERENVEMFAATANGVQMSSIQGTVVYAKDNEVHIDTNLTEFCMMQTGILPYQVGDTVTVWVAFNA